jgi:hypothetical protein
MDEHQMKQRSVALAIALFGKEAADKWWNTPNRTFEGRTPAGVWLEKPEDVYNYLMRFA